MPTTKAWTYTTPGYPETLQQTSIPVPATPAPHHLLVEVKASALNPVDIQLMNMPTNSLPYLRGPKITGRDFAGVVLAAAAPDTTFLPGDEVMGVYMGLDGSGTLTEIAHLDARSACIVEKPARMSWTEAASLPLVWLTAYTSVERCAPFMKKPIPAENKLAVLGGSSATGMYSIRIAKARGWTVLSSCSGRNEAFVRGRGADEVVDYTAAPDAVRNAVAAFKPDAIIDCVGGTECIGLANQYVTIVGDKTDRSAMGGSLLYLTKPRMLLRWLLGYLGLGKSYECIMLEQRREWLQKAAELTEDEIVIDSVFSFDEAKEAFERLNTGRTRGKVVVRVDS
ncbi:alcohol dehydrogenase [Xylariaceae sp. AK1471]|nr:alcohol dehydrogenase [Xylariaceae sp. AK1471]